MIRELSAPAKTALVTGIATVFGLLSTVILPNVPLPARAPTLEVVHLLIRMELFITTFNLVLLVALTWSYVSLYRDLPNKYSMSLVVLSLALVLYAISSNPLVQLLFGFPPVSDLGPFGFIPDVFVGFAIIVLFYQSQT
ncbi:hypothetical protein [Halopiger aswanensis]|uniref:Uncharacterized protein n=1 Tax=Halopiger aswanensis TaxID=148449 RepID=A0A3R7FXM4_9EURY|nr:hypothetical protein [Halopiger aswanensis]RKD97558.1 hypothetical protein ATJ93_0547 [Halopiger aswanensis]